MTEKTKKEIAKYATLYLKNRLTIKQALLTKNENKISFENFMNIYNKFQEHLEYLEKHPEKNVTLDNDQETTFAEKINRQKYHFISENADFVLLKESQIDEVLDFVKESIESYGLNHRGSYYNETFFIREALDRLLNELIQLGNKNDLEKIQKLKQFKSFFYATETIGFCEKLEGTLIYEDEEFCISTHESNKVCKINKEGINEGNKNELEDEDLLIAEKMYVGKLTNSDNTICVFLEKKINGQRKMKAISYNQELYDIAMNENPEQEVMDDKVIIIDKLNDYFAKMGFDFLTSEIFDKDSLQDTLNAYNKINEMLPEERKEMEEQIEIGASWWISKIYNPSFDYGMEEIKVDVIAKWLETAIGRSKEKRVHIFEQNLKNRMKLLLLARVGFTLYTDWRPEGELAFIIKESGLMATFPTKTKMNISKEEISVKEGSSANFEIIYSKKNTEDIKR